MNDDQNAMLFPEARMASNGLVHMRDFLELTVPKANIKFNNRSALHECPQCHLSLVPYASPKPCMHDHVKMKSTLETLRETFKGYINKIRESYNFRVVTLRRNERYGFPEQHINRLISDCFPDFTSNCEYIASPFLSVTSRLHTTEIISFRLSLEFTQEFKLFVSAITLFMRSVSKGKTQPKLCSLPFHNNTYCFYVRDGTLSIFVSFENDRIEYRCENAKDLLQYVHEHDSEH